MGELQGKRRKILQGIGEETLLIRIPHMLMIGSAGRNTGKTLLATYIIRSLKGAFPVFGLKITAIREKDGSCPRGGQGCGVCSSLKGDFCLTEETNPKSPKDTSRLLAAGAARVFWLRVMRNSLEHGMKKYLETIPAGAAIICESNSARKSMDPGLFIMTKKTGERRNKPSAEEVIDLVDRIAGFDGDDFDLNLENVSFVNSSWALRERAAAIILAGGKSSRMGKDKAHLSIKGKPMIARLFEKLQGNFDRILVSSSEPEKYAFLNVQVVPDKYPDQGPLMGIASAMQASGCERNFVIACDIPEPNLHLVRKMLRKSRNCDAVVPVFKGDKIEPLFAVYKRSLLPLIQETLSLGKRRIRDFFEFCKVKKLEIEDMETLRNINTLKDFEEYKDVVF